MPIHGTATQSCVAAVRVACPSPSMCNDGVPWTHHIHAKRIVQVADVWGDLTVPVKWLDGSKPNSEKMKLLKCATPNLLDLARQLLGEDISVCI